MRTNSAIPIVQQKRGELITNMIVRTYKNCTIIQNYAKELEYNNIPFFGVFSSDFKRF